MCIYKPLPDRIPERFMFALVVQTTVPLLPQCPGMVKRQLRVWLLWEECVEASVGRQYMVTHHWAVSSCSSLCLLGRQIVPEFRALPVVLKGSRIQGREPCGNGGYIASMILSTQD